VQHFFSLFYNYKGILIFCKQKQINMLLFPMVTSNLIMQLKILYSQNTLQIMNCLQLLTNFSWKICSILKLQRNYIYANIILEQGFWFVLNTGNINHIFRNANRFTHHVMEPIFFFSFALSHFTFRKFSLLVLSIACEGIRNID
jgi:hypothetical protein